MDVCAIHVVPERHAATRRAAKYDRLNSRCVVESPWRRCLNVHISSRCWSKTNHGVKTCLLTKRNEEVGFLTAYCSVVDPRASARAVSRSSDSTPVKVIVFSLSPQTEISLKIAVDTARYYNTGSS